MDKYATSKVDLRVQQLQRENVNLKQEKLQLEKSIERYRSFLISLSDLLKKLMNTEANVNIVEKEFKKFGFTCEKDPKIIKKHIKEDREMIKNVLPVWKELRQLTKSRKRNLK